MKKLLLTTAVVLLTVFGSSANAELVLTSSNNGSFTFDPASVMGGSGLVSNGDQGLDDIAVYLGYQPSAFGSQSLAPVRLTSGTAVQTSLNTGSFNFDPVTFSNGVTVNATANFRLTDATGFSGIPDVRHHVLYDLELTTQGVDGNTEGSLQSFIGFDFNGDGNDAIQSSEVISGFGNSEISIGSDDGAGNARVLVGDFTFAQGQGGTNVASNNTNLDAFNGVVGANVSDRLNSATESFSTGDLGFGAFSDFEGRDVDRTDTTAGVFGFRSASVSATIPEPSTLMMASMGLGMVAFRRRKRA